MSHFWTCAAPQHSEHSKAPVRGRARPSHALPNASQPRQGTNLLWDPSLGLREGMRNTIILDSLQCFSAESRIWSYSKRRRQKKLHLTYLPLERSRQISTLKGTAFKSSMDFENNIIAWYHKQFPIFRSSWARLSFSPSSNNSIKVLREMELK